MHILYKITYTPHLGTDYPKYYIGSKYNYRGIDTYFGSPSSKQIYEYTDGKALHDWWKTLDTTKMIFEILSEHDNITAKALVVLEHDIHLQYDVQQSNEYFNNAIATLGFVSSKKSNNTRKLMSEKTKAYWNSPEGIEKRKRLSERNKKVKSEQMKKRWQNPTDAMINMPRPGRSAGKPNGPLKTPRTQRGCLIKGKIYNNAKIASKYINEHPTTIRRKCKNETINNYEYLEQR